MHKTSIQTFRSQLQKNRKFKWNNPFVILISGTNTWTCNNSKSLTASRISNQWSMRDLRSKRRTLMKCLQIHSKLSWSAPTKNKAETASKLPSTIIKLTYHPKSSQKHQLSSQRPINRFKTIQRLPKAVRRFHLSAVDPSQNRTKAVRLQFSNLLLKYHRPLTSLWLINQ